MANFWQALAYAGPSAYNAYNQEHALQVQRQAAGAYGGGLSQLGASPYPMPPPPGTPPQQYSSQPTPPGTPTQQPQYPNAFPQPKPMPPQSSQPMPSSGPSQSGTVMPPGSPMPQGPMRDVTPQQGPQPMPQQQGEGGQSTDGQGPFAGMNLPQVIQAIKQHAPGISDEALGAAVDRFMPMFSAAAQYQYRQMVNDRMNARLDETHAWHGTQADLGQQRIDAAGDRAQGVEGRFQQREQRLQANEARIAGTRLPPDQAAQQKFFGQRYNEMSHSARDAYDNLTRLQSYNAPQSAIDQAQEAYTRADALRWQASEDYERFLGTVKPGATPAAAPAAGTKPAASPKAATPKSVGVGPNGQPLFPVGPQSSSGPPPVQGGQWSAGGQGGNDSTSQGPVVGPTRARPASADVWDNPDSPLHPRKGPFPNSQAPIPDLVSANNNDQARSVKRAKIANTNSSDTLNTPDDSGVPTLADIQKMQKDLNTRVQAFRSGNNNFAADRQRGAMANSRMNNVESDPHVGFALKNISRNMQAMMDYLDSLSQPSSPILKRDKPTRPSVSGPRNF